VCAGRGRLMDISWFLPVAVRSGTDRVSLLAHRQSATRAPRVGGQPRGGGASGPAAMRGCIETGSGSDARGDSSVALVTAGAGTASVTAHAGIEAHAPGASDVPHSSLDPGTGECARSWDAALVESPRPCAHGPRLPSMVSWSSSRQVRKAAQRRMIGMGRTSGRSLQLRILKVGGTGASCRRAMRLDPVGTFPTERATRKMHGRAFANEDASARLTA
jgi:hypothetical protein